MNTSVKAPYYWPLASTVLSIAAPLQKIFDKPGLTHLFCNRQAIGILKNDGFNYYAGLLEQHYNHLSSGSIWADQGWKNATHYFDPWKGRGIRNCPHALWAVQIYLSRAGLAWQRRKFSRAVFFLGAASHLVQDMCVPHHASSTIFAGHQAFESWAQENCHSFQAMSDGDYRKKSAAEWLTANAKVAFELVHLVKDRFAGSYETATDVLLPLAQRTSAGFFADFFRQMGVSNGFNMNLTIS